MSDHQKLMIKIMCSERDSSIKLTDKEKMIKKMIIESEFACSPEYLENEIKELNQLNKKTFCDLCEKLVSNSNIKKHQKSKTCMKNRTVN